MRERRPALPSWPSPAAAVRLLTQPHGRVALGGGRQMGPAMRTGLPGRRGRWHRRCRGVPTSSPRLLGCLPFTQLSAQGDGGAWATWAPSPQGAGPGHWPLPVRRAQRLHAALAPPLPPRPLRDRGLHGAEGARMCPQVRVIQFVMSPFGHQACVPTPPAQRRSQLGAVERGQPTKAFRGVVLGRARTPSALSPYSDVQGSSSCKPGL